MQGPASTPKASSPRYSKPWGPKPWEKMRGMMHCGLPSGWPMGKRVVGVLAVMGYLSLSCWKRPSSPQSLIHLVHAMKVILAQLRGFCAGVVRAIEIVERALQKYGPPVYVRHEIVHNKHVVENLKAKGARFVEDLSEVPSGAVTIFSAHGGARSGEEG